MAEVIEPSEPVLYQIRLEGHLAPEWTEWFGGMTLVLEAGGETLLMGPVVDQAALHGLLRKVRDLGMPLLSLYRVRPSPACSPETGEANEPEVER